MRRGGQGAGADRYRNRELWSAEAQDDELLPLCVLVWCGRQWPGVEADAGPGPVSGVAAERSLGEPTRRPGGPRSVAEDALLKELSRGDERALEALYLAHERRLHWVAYRYLQSAWAARAVVQDVFASVWYRRETLRVRTSIESYLMAAVRKRALTVLREELRRRERDALWGRGTSSERALAGPHEGLEPDRHPPRRAVGGTQASKQGQHRCPDCSEIRPVLATLPERQRLAYELRVERRFTNADVRMAIGAVSVKAVEMLYARAVKTLRARCPEAQIVCREGSIRSAET